IHRPHGKAAAGVANPSFVDHADVNADDVPLLERLLLAGDAVADGVVDRDTDRRWKRWAYHLATPVGYRAVALVHWQRAAVADELLGDAIQIGGGYAWHHMWPQRLVRLGYNATGVADHVNLLGSLPGHGHGNDALSASTSGLSRVYPDSVHHLRDLAGGKT